MSALHIIGGDMTYECNTPGNYVVTMKVYRDCNSGGAPYDSPAQFAIFQGPNLVRQLTANPTNIITIPPDNDPCFEVNNPPCVQSATYVLNISNLTVSNNSYFISYQRCCRNETINNINIPGDVGSTYTIEITPEAQQTCNNSPVFNDFPPIVICAGEYINFDHSATDIEGDSLVYSFCSPLIGGGIDGGPDNPNGNANGPNGVQPIPPTAPPYNTVTFISPTYTAFTPMGGNPVVNIDPVTGIIDGVPITPGQFVVGVCVQEFRDGMLLGEIRRDFQFNVIPCTPLVVADLASDSIIGEKKFLINSCGDFTVDIENESFQESNIFDYEWVIDIGNGNTFTSSDRDVSVTFPGLGTYTGYMALNPGTACADTAEITINLFPDIEADFSFDYDTCIAGPVTFTDLSTTGSGQFQSWEWQFGDGNTSSTQNPVHDYMIPGSLPATLIVTDINECVDSKTIPVDYFPAPAILIVEPSIFEGCAPQDVFYNNLSFPIDSTYNIVWDFGDGNTSSEISPSHTYTEPGTYTVTLDVTSPIGCNISDVFPNFVRVRPAPTAAFSYTPQQLTNFNNTVFITDESIDAEAWLWTFSDFPAPVLDQNPTHTFQDTGFHEIQLVVRHESGCLDTAIAIIEVEPIVTYHIPNAFTPNGDGKNEEFKGIGFFDGMRDFRMTIWNRWGELIFETPDPEQGWNGRKNNEGDILQKGVYVAIIEYTEPRGQRIRLKGFATLVR